MLLSTGQIFNITSDVLLFGKVDHYQICNFEGGIILSPSRRSVIINSVEVDLQKKEFDILHYLMSNSECILTHSQILHRIWGDKDEIDNNVIWRTINRLRNKLSKLSPKIDFIKVERNVGYKFISKNY